MHAQQAGDVVDVVVELGDEQQRLAVQLGSQAGDVAGVARGRAGGSRGSSRPPGRPARGRAPLRAPRRCRALSASASMSWWTRLTTTPANGSPESARERRNQIASSVGAVCAEATSTNAVVSARSIASTCRARTLKSSVIPPSSWKNVLRSAIRSIPVIRRSATSSGAAPRPSTRIPRPVGRMNALSALPSRNDVSRAGASRKSIALRDGGVSSTSRSKFPSARARTAWRSR